MGKEIVTLYIEDAGLQLLVTSGKHIKKWARLPLEPGLVKGSVVMNEEEVARAIGELMNANKVKNKKVIVGLSGLRSLTRPFIVSAAPRAKLAEIVLREARKLLPVPLEQLYVSWQTAPMPGKKLQVFLVAIPRKTVESAMATLLRAGLKPQFLDLKPLALARLVREKSAIIVDVQPAEADIVVMVDGVPQPIRTLPLGEGTVAERLKAVGDDVARTIEFHNSSNPDSPLNAAAPLYVGGELAAEPSLARQLSERIGHPVSILSSPLPCRELPDLGTYLVNIGLALKELPSVKRGASPATNVNAVPIAYRPKPISLARAVALPVVIAAGGMLLPMVMVLQADSDSNASLRLQLDNANRLVAQRQRDETRLKAEVAALEKKAAGADATYGGLVLELKGLKTSADRVNGDLWAILDSMDSSSVRMDHISYTKDTVTVIGTFPTQSHVTIYAANLNSTGRFSGVVITSMVRKGDAVEFVVEMRH